MAIKVLIVDDHPAVRDGLAGRIAAEPGMEVCGQAADTAEAIKLIEAVRPDVVVVDIQLETGNGLDLIQRINARDESIGVLVWSMFPDAVYAERAIQAGALGYINKRHATSQIVEAIRCVGDGNVYLCEETARRLLGQKVGRRKRPQASGVELLSDRELEVFHLVGQGLTAAQIARRLHRSANTVESHREKIKAKLGLKTAAELNRAAVQWVLENG